MGKINGGSHGIHGVQRKRARKHDRNGLLPISESWATASVLPANRQHRLPRDCRQQLRHIGDRLQPVQRQLSLYVSGANETSSFCDFAVPNDLLLGNLSLILDGSTLVEGVDYTQTSNSTHNIFQVTYSGEDIHTIELISSDAIPEFPNVILLSTFMVAILVATIIYRKKLR